MKIGTLFSEFGVGKLNFFSSALQIIHIATYAIDNACSLLLEKVSQFHYTIVLCSDPSLAWLI